MRIAAIVLLLVLAAPPMSSQTASGEPNVTRATLDNGLRVVIIRDPLAPVVTVEDNYLVGANDTPEGFPGMAHAQEHMAFRGCAGVSADQTAAIFAQLGGFGNAIRELYGKIERRPLGSRSQVSLGPVKPESFTLESNLPGSIPRRDGPGLDDSHSGLELSSLELTRLAPPAALASDFDAVQSAFIR